MFFKNSLDLKKNLLFYIFCKLDTSAQFKVETATIFQVQIKPDSTFVKMLKVVMAIFLSEGRLITPLQFHNFFLSRLCTSTHLSEEKIDPSHQWSISKLDQESTASPVMTNFKRYLNGNFLATQQPDFLRPCVICIVKNWFDPFWEIRDITQ